MGARSLAAARPERQVAMRAAVLAQPGRFDVETHLARALDSREVRLRIEGCGVCGSDRAPWHGASWFAYPFPPGAPGHEAWGVVSEVGEDVHEVHIGQRVAALGHHGYAEYDIVPVDAVVPLSDLLGSVPLPAEPIACAMNVLARSAIEPGQTVVIIGIGFLGALLTRLGATAGASVIAVSRRPFALSVAAEMGAAATIPLDHDRAVTAANVLDCVDGDGAPCVIEAVGRQDTLELATSVTGTRGRLVIAGYHQDGPRMVDMQRWNWRGIDVINAHERDPAVYVRGMRAGVAAVASGRLAPEQLITHRFPLDRLDEAMRLMSERPDGFLKAVIEP